MGAIDDELRKAAAAWAKKWGGAAQDEDQVRLLHQIKNHISAPTIKYKPRAPGKPAKLVDSGRRKANSVKKRTQVTANVKPIDGAAMDRRIRLGLLKSRRAKYVPLSASLGVYRKNSANVKSVEQGSEAVKPAIVRIDPEAQVIRPSAERSAALLGHVIEDRGIALQHILGTVGQTRELVLGIDFGSSSTKLVISDRAAGRAYSVAVVDAHGVTRYLLPTALRFCDGRYTLDGDGTLHTGLKSDLLTSSKDPRVRERAVAYLALAIRRARGWLFEFHDAIYRDVKIFWTLTIGIPKQQGPADRDQALYTRLAAAAWQVAGLPGPVTHECVMHALRQNGGSAIDDETVEIRVVPEIAAEIYGFVSSESFDPKGWNNFLMVDIGGKTLDASLFHARPEKANQWNFSFYTSVVKQLGAIELHAARIEWWKQMMRDYSQGAQAERMLMDLDALQQAAMFEERIPAKATDYIAGVELTRGAETAAPDRSFREKARIAVRMNAYEHAFGRQLSDRQMDQVEYFLCGGGSRMAFYSGMLHSCLANGGRFRAKRRSLAIPADFDAPGLLQPDYDRFAVAYGLSRLDKTRVVDVEPLPPRKAHGDPAWDRLVTKEMC